MIYNIAKKSRSFVLTLLGIAWVVSATVATKGKLKFANLAEGEATEGEAGAEEGGEAGTAEAGEGEAGGEEGAEEEEEELEVSGVTVALCVMSIITVIVGLTILFEIGKDKLLESANEHVKPIVRQMFQELTVLGFLSLFVFLLATTKTLENISGAVFGASEEGQDYLGELVEITHYIIFLIMGLNIFQVFMLINIGNDAHKRWGEYNEVSQDEEAMQGIILRLSKMPPLTLGSGITDYFTDPVNAWSKHSSQLECEELVHFYSLRKEFLLQRSPLPPFAPVSKNALPQNFDYAQYQAECMSEFLTELIELTPPVWAVVWSLTLLFILVIIGAPEHSIAPPIIWVVLAYLETVFIFIVHQKCTSILKFLVNAKDFKPTREGLEEFMKDGERDLWQKDNKDKPSDTAAAVPGEDTALIKPEVESEIFYVDDNGDKILNEDAILSSDLDKPAWTVLDGNKKSQGMCGDRPRMMHRQFQLYWFEDLGPEFNLFVLKTHLVLHAIYMAVLFIIYIPEVYTHHGTTAGFFYMLFSIIPLIAVWTGFYGALVVNMSHIASTGLLVDRHVVNGVIRKQKTAKTVKLILMLTKLTSFVPGTDSEVPYDPKDPHIIAQSAEMSEMFDHFDQDNDGVIHVDDLDEVLNAMGIQLDAHQKAQMLVSLDKDGDGDVTREEFIHWQLCHRSTDDAENLKDTAKRLFSIFDADGGGTVTVEEFKTELDKLDAGLSIDEVVALVREFDTDGDGEISLEEFEKVIESAYE